MKYFEGGDYYDTLLARRRMSDHRYRNLNPEEGKCLKLYRIERAKVQDEDIDICMSKAVTKQMQHLAQYHNCTESAIRAFSECKQQVKNGIYIALPEKSVMLTL